MRPDPVLRHGDVMDPRRAIPWAMAATVAALVLAGASWWLAHGDPGRSGVERVQAATPATRAVDVVHAWDARRADAWARADAAALSALYREGSSAGRRDLEALRAWQRRGWVVSGISRQVRSLEVEVAQDDVVRLRLTDRLVGAVARRGSQERHLPAGAFRERTVQWRRIGTQWRLDEAS